MGRWRPPAQAHQPYITAAGFGALEIESRALWQRRREVVRHLAAAAAEGDRSENAEYQYRKKELREIDHRIRYLERRLPVLTVVSTVPDDTSRVRFGALVELEHDDGRRVRYRIVGSDEARPESGSISLDSPLAARLLGRELDEVVTHESGGELVIVSIEYPDPRL